MTLLSQVQTVFAHLQRRAIQTAEVQRATFTGGVHLALQVRDGETTITLRWKTGALSMASEIAVRKGCQVPSHAERIPATGTITREINSGPWKVISYRWYELVPLQPLFTVGYTGWSIDLLNRALDERNALLVDIRERPTSMRPEFGYASLAQRLGERYTHVPEFGNVNYRDGPIVLAQPRRGLRRARAYLMTTPVVLLCACRNWEMCHRRNAAEYIVSRLGISVVHLEPPGGRSGGPRAGEGL